MPKRQSTILTWVSDTHAIIVASDHGATLENGRWDATAVSPQPKRWAICLAGDRRWFLYVRGHEFFAGATEAEAARWVALGVTT